ncbi:hypothetical protein [Streptosporangium canum]|uniref:hypothetical protein n=1 Tax=Streptosporangium canum TaxID=324952 RepID=UPI00339E29F1
MTFNYYAVTSDTPADHDGLPIGQHAGGWEFLFRAYATRGLTTSEAWIAFLSRPEVTIRADNGDEMPVGEFMAWATTRPAQSAVAMRERPPCLPLRRPR